MLSLTSSITHSAAAANLVFQHLHRCSAQFSNHPQLPDVQGTFIVLCPELHLGKRIQSREEAASIAKRRKEAHFREGNIF